MTEQQPWKLNRPCEASGEPVNDLPQSEVDAGSPVPGVGVPARAGVGVHPEPAEAHWWWVRHAQAHPECCEGTYLHTEHTPPAVPVVHPEPGDRARDFDCRLVSQEAWDAAQAAVQERSPHLSMIDAALHSTYAVHAAAPFIAAAAVEETVDGQANDCRHDSASGVDTAAMGPGKVWRCDHCGLRWRQGDGKELR